MSLVTEKDIAIGICEYLQKTTADFVFSPSGEVDRNSNVRRVKEYLASSAPVLGRKKNWIFTNDNGEIVKFIKVGAMTRIKERYVDGDLYETWIVELESDKQSIHAVLEWNDTSCCTVAHSGLTLSDKVHDL